MKNNNKQHKNFYLGRRFKGSSYQRDYNTAIHNRSLIFIKLGTIRVEIEESELYKSLYN